MPHTHPTAPTRCRDAQRQAARSAVEASTVVQGVGDLIESDKPPSPNSNPHPNPNMAKGVATERTNSEKDVDREIEGGTTGGGSDGGSGGGGGGDGGAGEGDTGAAGVTAGSAPNDGRGRSAVEAEVDAICASRPQVCACKALNPNLIIYNRIPKCGSGSMNVFIGEARTRKKEIELCQSQLYHNRLLLGATHR